jgi:hypothetical protein
MGKQGDGEMDTTLNQRCDWALAAWDNIERHLADAVAEDGLDSIQENMYTLAYDGAIDAGADPETAADIAVMHCGEPA